MVKPLASLSGWAIVKIEFFTFAAVNRIIPYILLFIFTGFLVSISVDFKLYLKIVNAGASVEDVTSMPEEHHEKSSSSDSKFKEHLSPGGWMLNPNSIAQRQYFITQHFSIKENIYFDVPYSPPKQAHSSAS